MVAKSGRVHVDGQDLVMDLPTRFGLGFEISDARGRVLLRARRAHLRPQRLGWVARLSSTPTRASRSAT